ncbi:MAG TPA: hybrid sensor histidine kinase/response regulator [Candidatus Limnocylindria bacterium]|nr:hybrid sensor histidine kinase/response regulator [Candidatus Limnocylindria bacterium]
MASSKVLVVDDEQSVATTIKAILELDGSEVTAVTSGKEALAQLREHEFDVVLTDLRLDDLDGIEILRETQKLWPDTVAIMLTGYASLESAVAALRSGAYDYLIKPSDVDELRATIGRALERRQLRQRLVELEQLDRLKTQFLSMASHELRTPLTAVTGFMQIARRRMSRLSTAGEVPEQWRDEAHKANETLEMANRQSKKLARLIDELLDVSRLEQGRVELRLAEMELGDVVSDVAERMRLLSKGHEIDTKIEGKAAIVGDRDRIEQVLENLVGNAIKYTPGEGRIEVSLRVNGANAMVSVRDEGIGISPTEVEKVFGLFYRSPDPRADHVGGLGLGLYISREIVSRHHGKLWAERNKDAGMTFHLTLPLAKVKSPD